MATGIAGQMAMSGLRHWGKGLRPSARDLLLSPGNMRRIATELSQMRGAAMKIGQLISMDAGDILPPEVSQVFAQLRSDAHFMPPRQLKQVLNATWPSHWAKAFDSFDVRPIAAASIGQVHRATLRDGRSLAIKVQYPGVRKSIDSDLANVATLLRLTGLVPAGIDLAPYLAEARSQLHDETDYGREAASLRDFAQRLDGDERFVVPEVHDDWSSETILSMSHVPGHPIEGLADGPQDRRDEVATRLIELLLREVFEFRLVQTDANFANYRFDPEISRIALLDFGATRRLDPGVVVLCRGLLVAGLAGDREALRHAVQVLGLAGEQVRGELPDLFLPRIVAMLEELFAALTENAVFDFASSDLARRMHDRAMALARDGYHPAPVPMDIFHIQRKMGGIFLLASRLRARVPVRALLERCLAEPAA